METNYDRAWSPKEYLAHYYDTKDISQDEQEILKFIVDFFKERKLCFDDMIEIGCGPTIHHMLPFVPHVQYLYMADYMQSNLNEIEKWLKESPEAYDWSPYLTNVLSHERRRSPKAFKERVNALRSQITGLLHCNVLSENPLGDVQRTFRLLTSFYCLECVTDSKEQWLQSMRNMSSLIAPGGWIILSALRDTNTYVISGKKFPVTRINEHDIHDCLVANGFVPSSVTVTVCQSPEWASEGFSSIIIASAQLQS